MPLPFSGKSQTYHKLIQDSVYWDEIKFNYQGDGCFGYDSIKRLFFETDTTIGGVLYSKVKYYNFISLDNDSFCPPFEIAHQKYELFNIFVREDTLERKVYILDIGFSPVEQLLFDFSLQPNDMFYNTYYMEAESLFVSNIDSIQLYDGSYRRRINMDGVSTGQSYSFIEGIGCFEGLLHGVFNDGVIAYQMLCVKEKTVPLYGYCVTYFTNINRQDNKFDIFPNPTCEYINVSCQDIHQKCFAKIYNLCGEVIQQAEIVDENTLINISSASPGLYFFMITNAVGETILKKRLIKTK